MSYSVGPQLAIRSSIWRSVLRYALPPKRTPSATAAVSMASTSSALSAWTVKPWTVRSGGVDCRGTVVGGGRVVVGLDGGRGAGVVGAGGPAGRRGDAVKIGRASGGEREC